MATGTLTGTTIAARYKSLLKITGTGNDVFHATTLKAIEDGDGNDSSLSLSQQKAKILLGTDSGDDFTINNGSADIVLVEGDTNDVSLLNDLKLVSDSAKLSFGADADVYLTHDHNTGILLNGTSKLQFNDSSQYIQGASGTVLDIAATDEIELTATEVEINVTTLDVNGNADVSGTLDVDGNVAFDGGTFTFNTSELDKDFRIASENTTNLLFCDASTDRVGINTSSPDTKLDIEDNATSGAVATIKNTHASVVDGDNILALQFSGDATATEGNFIIFSDSNTAEMGVIKANSATVVVDSYSDYRLKDNISTLTGGLSKVNALNPVTFQYKSDEDNVNHEGFIAHEVQEHIPYAVRGVKDAVKDDGSIKAQSFCIYQLIPHLVLAIKELSSSNDALKARIEVLEAA